MILTFSFVKIYILYFLLLRNAKQIKLSCAFAIINKDIAHFIRIYEPNDNAQKFDKKLQSHMHEVHAMNISTSISFLLTTNSICKYQTSWLVMT